MAELLQTFDENKKSLDSLILKDRVRKRLNMNFNNVNSLRKDSNVSPRAIDDIVKLSEEAIKQSSQDTQKAASIDTSALYNNLSSVINSSRSKGDTNASLVSFSELPFRSFNFSALTKPVSQLTMDKFNTTMEAIRNMDPEFSEKLFVLLNAIANLNPEDSESIFKNLNDTMEQFVNLTKNLQSVSQNGAPAVPIQTQQASQQPIQQQSFSFVLDIDIKISEKTEATIAQLQENGFSVFSEKSEQNTNVHIQITYGQPKQTDPLVVDLGSDGVDLTDVKKYPTTFDINGDGKLDAAAFAKGNDGLLALDKNGNGTIDDGRELFGDQNGALNGFEELAKYDSNLNNMIDEKDEHYNDLQVLYDKNVDGKIANDEISSLKELGIKIIDLNYKTNAYDDSKGNSIAEKSTIERSDGTKINIYDVLLGFYG